MINQWKVEQAAELPSKLWRFLLLLSQDYSVYYGRHRALCVSFLFGLLQKRIYYIYFWISRINHLKLCLPGFGYKSVFLPYMTVVSVYWTLSQ